MLFSYLETEKPNGRQSCRFATGNTAMYREPTEFIATTKDAVHIGLEASGTWRTNHSFDEGMACKRTAR